MSRTIKQIYSEAIYVRNNYLQLTELDSGRTQSKMSIMNLMTYVMSVLIYTYEVVLDAFQINVVKSVSSRINGTPAWYAAMALKFQFDPINMRGDKMVFNEDTFSVEYESVDDSHKIITNAAYEEYSIHDAIILKVSKDNDDSSETDNAMFYKPLTDVELAAFKSYIKAIKFVGAKVYCTSMPGDIITIRSNGASIYYDEMYTTDASVLNGIKEALVGYVKSLKYNQYVYYQSFIDAIQGVDHVLNIDAGIVVEVRTYNQANGIYNEPIQIIGQYRPKSGYVGFIDEFGNATINLDNLQLTPISEI